MARPRTDDPGPHEALRTDQVDAEAVELGRRLLEEAPGVLDGQLERGRLVRRRQLGGDVDAPGQRLGQLADHVGQQRDVGLAPGQLDGQRRGVPDVLGGAPPPGSSSSTTSRRTSQSSYDVVGHDEADPGHDDRLAARPPVVAVEAGGQRGHLVGVGDGAADDQRVG